MASPSRATSLRAFAQGYDVVLCDVFGTLHDETGVFAPAVEALARCRQAGRIVVLVSNSAHPGAGLAETLARQGVPPSAFDAIVTSADVTRRLLRERPGAVHHIGLPGERVLFEGLQVAFASVEAADLIVCTGYPEEDPAPVLTRAAERGLELVCTNPDTTATAGDRVLRFAGLVADAYRAIGGQVTDTGKPGGAIYAATLERVAEMTGRMPVAERVLCIGDSLALDIVGAVARGFGALWIAGEQACASPPPAAAIAPSLAW